MAKVVSSSCASAGALQSSKTRLWVRLAALGSYVAVGWCVLAVVKAIMGDPVTNYLLATHTNAMSAVRFLMPLLPRICSCLLPAPSPERRDDETNLVGKGLKLTATVLQASMIFHILLNAMVGFIVLTALYRVVVEESAEDTEQRNKKLAMLRHYDKHWDEDVAHCEEVMRVGSKSFFLASWLLPGWMRGPSLALYSFCRKADDDVDEGDEAGAAARLGRLQQRLRDAYAGNPAETCVDRAFSACVRAFEIPIEITS